MKSLLYFRLAVSGIRKNKKLYIPYLLTCIGMVMMSHILQSLSYSPALFMMHGGSQMGFILSLGKFVVAVFAGLFLLYTNSFLIRRRNKEFGLYNVLGMDKTALGWVIFWENIIVAGLGLGLGLVFGMGLYKLAELALLNIIHGSVDYSFTVSPESVKFTLCIFLPIFALLMVKSVWQVRRAKPLELLRSENAGEKPPKANYLLGLGGLVLLAGAYYLSVSSSNAMAAFTWFFVAVMMVILATYLLMISGSVVLCRLLQKNKNYYYKKQHFVSVSSMAYRMKRNGAGLASICVLATMVLVMISSTSSLYIGAEDSLKTRYPHDSGFTIYRSRTEDMDASFMNQIEGTFQEVYARNGAVPQNVERYRYANIAGVLNGNEIDPNASDTIMSTLDYSILRQIIFVPVEDYNAVKGTELTLEPGQAMVGCLRCSYEDSDFRLGALNLEIVGRIPEMMSTGEAVASVVPSITLVISDLSELEPLESLADYKGRKMLSSHYYYGCDFDLPEEQIIQIHNQQRDALMQNDALLDSNRESRWTEECPARVREDFYITFGGLFFIGIMLSGVFIAAAALIIYYKQVSEGYEDQSRFAIMRKVGMTRQDIKKSINSQILTVFFAPLLMAGLHLVFAFPMVWQLLQMFNLRNLQLVIWTNIGAFLVFCLFYVIIYKFTARAYYGIVSGDGKE